jgi:hypothetical protein
VPRYEFFDVSNGDDIDVIEGYLRTRLDPRFADETICIFFDPDAAKVRWLKPEGKRAGSTMHVRVYSSIDMSYEDSLPLARALNDFMDVEMVLPSGAEIFFPKDSCFPRVQTIFDEDLGERIVVESPLEAGDQLAWNIGRAVAVGANVEIILHNQVSFSYSLRDFVPRDVPM